MPMIEVKDRDYQRRVEEAMIRAIMDASRIEGTNTVALMSGEIVQAALNVIALMAGTSEATASPTRSRKFADDCARTIQIRVAEVRRKRDAGEMGFMTVVAAGDRN